MTAPNQPEVLETEGNSTEEVVTDESKWTLEDLQKELAKTRREAAGYRVKAKENETAKSELDKIKEAQMSELEKANKRIADLEALTKTSAKEAALEVAKAKYGFDADDLEFVKGDTPEEIAASAEKLAKRLGVKEEGTTATTSSGSPNLFPGTRGKPVGKDKEDVNEYLRKQLRGEA